MRNPSCTVFHYRHTRQAVTCNALNKVRETKRQNSTQLAQPNLPCHVPPRECQTFQNAYARSSLAHFHTCYYTFPCSARLFPIAARRLPVEEPARIKRPELQSRWSGKQNNFGTESGVGRLVGWAYGSGLGIGARWPDTHASHGHNGIRWKCMFGSVAVCIVRNRQGLSIFRARGMEGVLWHFLRQNGPCRDSWSVSSGKFLLQCSVNEAHEWCTGWVGSQQSFPSCRVKI